MEMTLQRGLSEIKLLEGRINKEIANGIFITNITGKSNKTNNNLSKDEFSKQVVSTKQSIEDLLTRRNKIKSAIVLANAINKVKIVDKEYFICEAIERKNSIVYEVEFLEKLKRNLNLIEQDTDRRNQQMESKLDSLLSDKASSDKSKLDEVINFQTSYRELNETKIFDVINIRQYIKDLETSIENFKSEVDFCLSQANNTIKIEI